MKQKSASMNSQAGHYYDTKKLKVYGKELAIC